jgi:integrase
VRTYQKTGHKAIYIDHGAYYLVRQGKWIRLCSVDDGESAMLRALAKIRGRTSKPRETMLGLIQEWREKRLPGYAEEVQKDYGYCLAKIEANFRDFDVADVDVQSVKEFRNLWGTKRARSAQKYQALLSVILTYAVEEGIIERNPCRELPKIKPKPRRQYMSDDTMLKVTDAAVVGRRHNGSGKAWTNANGEMYALLFTLAYLTSLRAKDCRLLRKSDINEEAGEITVQPTKTKASSGARIAIDITPDIQAIIDRAKALDKERGIICPWLFHTLKGGCLSQYAVRSAWRRARERAEVAGSPWFRDLRPKALSDAKRRGVTLDALRDAAGHTNVATTEGYLRGFEVKESRLDLAVPKRKKSA